MNCFCSLKDWYLLQHKLEGIINRKCCELLLFFERLIFATTVPKIGNIGNQLWIAFVLWKIDICYNAIRYIKITCVVVNCFCSLKDWYLLQQVPFWCKLIDVVNCFCSLKDWYLLQLDELVYSHYDGCELLLFFERLIFATTYLREC